MSEKQRNLLIVAMLLCGLSVVLIVVMVLLPEKYETVVTQQTPITHDTTPTTLPLVISININTAGIDELMVLPGMTRDIAVNILDYRFQYRKFLTVDELREVSGVTYALYADWSAYIFV